MDAAMIDLQLALQAAIRQGELNAQALIDTALVVRDLKTAIRQAIAAIDRKSYETARQELKQALDEMPVEQRRRERE
jgi:RNA polymerase-interacting CarD/CdnL/TRCF family regulator